MRLTSCPIDPVSWNIRNESCMSWSSSNQMEFVAHALDKDLRNSEVIYSNQMEFYSKRKPLCVK